MMKMRIIRVCRSVVAVSDAEQLKPTYEMMRMIDGEVLVFDQTATNV